MQKVPLFAGLLLFIALNFSFTNPPKEKIKWLNLQELKQAYAKKPKPILVDVYTSWCGWCKVMDKQTYENEAVIKYINENYYAVKFDAEATETVEWNGKKYAYNSQYKSNDLAIFFTMGQLSYPTTVFFPTINANPAPLAGFLKASQLEPPIRFFGDGAYKTKNYQEFMQSFKGSW